MKLATFDEGRVGEVRGGTVVELVVGSRWAAPAEDGARMAEARRYAATMEPYASGAYVNVLSDEGQDGVRRAYPAAKLARLTELKDRYDPDNVLHLNPNIPPSNRRSAASAAMAG